MLIVNFFVERGANLESRAAHTHPKNTQVPPPGLWQGQWEASGIRGLRNHTTNI